MTQKQRAARTAWQYLPVDMLAASIYTLSVPTGVRTAILSALILITGTLWFYRLQHIHVIPPEPKKEPRVPRTTTRRRLVFLWVWTAGWYFLSDRVPPHSNPWGWLPCAAFSAELVALFSTWSATTTEIIGVFSVCNE